MRHAYGCPPTAAKIIRRNAEAAAAAGVVDPYQPMVAHESGVQLFQHEHLSHVSFNIFSKLPVLPLRHMGDLHRTVNQRIALLVLQSRIQSRYAELDHEHYKRCELDHSDSARGVHRVHGDGDVRAAALEVRAAGCRRGGATPASSTGSPRASSRASRAR